MTLFEFLTRAAGARIVASDLRTSFHGLGRFGLRGSRLVLQIALLALLAAFHGARKIGQTRRRGWWLLGTSSGAGHSGGCVGT